MNSRLHARPDASQIAVFNGADIAELKNGFVVRTPDAFQRQITIAIAVFMLAFWAAHLVRWRFGAVGDPLLLPVVHLLTGLGMVAMLALRDPLRDTVAMATVAGGIGAGCAIWTALAFVDFEDPRLRRAVLAPLTAAVGLAIALIMFGSGPTGSNARVNLLGIQPVEVSAAARRLFSRRLLRATVAVPARALRGSWRAPRDPPVGAVAAMEGRTAARRQHHGATGAVLLAA